MHKFRYNLLALFQVAVSAGSILLMTRVLGVSQQADAFLLVFSSVAALQLLELMFFEQFMYFYNDARITGAGAAAEFYRFAQTWAWVVGAAALVFSLLFSGAVISLFARGFDGEKLRLARYFFSGFAPYLLFFPVMSVNERFLNAEKRFAWPYLISSLPMLGMLIVQLLMLRFRSVPVIAIPCAFSGGAAVAAAAGIMLARQMGFRQGVRLRHELGAAFIRNSMAIRLASNLNNFFVPLIVNNFLSYLSPGNISCYTYAQKMISALQSVSAGPSQKILASHISKSVSEGRTSEIGQHSRRYLVAAVCLLLALGGTGYLLLPPVLRVIAGNISAADVLLIRGVYASLIPWSLAMVFESPYTLAILSFKRSRVFVVVNSIFLAIFSLLLFGFRDVFGLYALPAAGFLAQLFNWFLFAQYVRRCIK